MIVILIIGTRIHGTQTKVVLTLKQRRERLLFFLRGGYGDRKEQLEQKSSQYLTLHLPGEFPY